MTDLEARKTKLEQLRIEARTKMDNVSMKFIQESVQLKNEVKKLKKELVMTKKIFENASKIALKLEKENKKLKARIGELEKEKQASATPDPPVTPIKVE